MNRRYTERIHQYLLMLTFIALSAIILSCAEIARPPGGEIDRTPPQVVSSSPVNGATNVPRGNVVRIEFSEPILKPTQSKTVYISPRPQKEPKIKVKSNRLQIIFADSFAIDQTYIISLAGSIEDLRRNKLDTGNVIAFSTGATIDSGHVSGIVTKRDQPQSRVIVGLYLEDTITALQSFDSLYPMYATETNSQGYFSFSYLPLKHYRLIAFIDRNKNELFDASVEPYAVTDRTIDLSITNAYDNLRMMLNEQDTVKPEIISVSFSADKMIKLRLSKPIDLEMIKRFPANIRLMTADSNRTAFPAKYLVGSDNSLSSHIECFVPNLVEGVYDLVLTYNADDDSLLFDSLSVSFVDDNSPPKILSFQPDSLPVYKDDLLIGIEFNEPIDSSKLTDETFTLWDNAEKRLQLKRVINHPASFSFTSEDIRAGGNYRMDITEFDILDMNNNPLGDSLLTYRFSTYNPDSLGSVSGTIAILNDSSKYDPFLLTFEKIGNGHTQTITVDRNSFNVDLPAGKYLLKGFLDSNMNEKYDFGTLFPFVPAETQAVYPDTVQVRARFETSEILFEIR